MINFNLPALTCNRGKDGIAFIMQTGLRIYHIITRVLSVNVWGYLKEGQELLPILERVLDKFYDWVKENHAKILSDCAQIESEARSEFKIFENKKKRLFIAKLVSTQQFCLK